MTDSAILKTYQAAKYIRDLNKFLSEARPFVLVIKTDTQTGKRTLGCEKHEPAVEIVALLCGDAIHNLRSALDHAYWEIVSPLCTSDRERGAVQFPFSSTEDRLDVAIQQRLAHYAGMGFYRAIRKLAPFGDLGGNILLSLVHQLDVIDKHKLLLPAIDESTHTFKWLEGIDPNIPWKGWGGSITLPEQATIEWTNNNVPPDQLGNQVGPNKFERILDVPINIFVPVTLHENIIIKLPPVVPLLDQMLDLVVKTITIMRKAIAFP